MYLGLEAHGSMVYEGDTNNPDRPVLPVPVITRATLVEREDDLRLLPPPTGQESKGWFFREDSFDHVTRTRRGRLYEAIDGMGYPHHGVRVFPQIFGEMGRGADGRIAKPLNVYSRCSALLRKHRRGVGSTLVLGNTDAFSSWRIVNVEVTFAGDVMVQLRALSAFDIIPDLDINAVDAAHRDRVGHALRSVLDSAFRELPTSVVDRCKDAAAALISSWLAQHGGPQSVLELDVGKLARVIESVPFEKSCVANLAKVLGRLHARGKPNEQASNKVRPPDSGDAEFAIQAVGLILRDLGWAYALR